MALTVSQRLERVRVRSEELRYWRAREGVAVGGWSIDGKPIELGGAWPSHLPWLVATATTLALN